MTNEDRKFVLIFLAVAAFILIVVPYLSVKVLT